MSILVKLHRVYISVANHSKINTKKYIIEFLQFVFTNYYTFQKLLMDGIIHIVGCIA